MIRFIIVVFFVVLFLICSIPVILAEWIIGIFHPALKDRHCQKIIQWAFRLVRFLCGTKVTYIGEENLPTDQSVLYVGNHKSYFDIVLSYIHFPAPTGFVAKQEMEKAPLLSTWMRNIRCLFLNRTDIKEGMKTILQGIEQLKSGVSICIFPEGTRCPDPDSFLPFKEGSMKLAEKAKCPIIPVSINNTRSIWENQFPAIKKAHVVIEYGRPIRIDQLEKEDRKRLGAYVQREIKRMYDKNKEMVQT